MFRKLAFICFLSLLLLPRGFVAAGEAAPEFNPLCWKAKDCDEARRKIYSAAKDGEGWVHELPCLGELGRCLPIGYTSTSIAFGGQRSFANIGEYIRVVYSYSIRVVGILATVMIIIAGIQWVTSGGSSDKITSAKKRIGGALIGLFLVYLSYTILNTINPSLVSLRLPQAWMLRTMNLTPQFCSDFPVSTEFSLAARADNQRTAVRPGSTVSYDLSLENRSPNNLRQFWCGARFFAENAGTVTCIGDYCPNTGEICVNLGEDPADPQKFYCKRTIMAGKISGTAGGSTGIVIGNDMELRVICKDGEDVKVEGIDVDNNTKTYEFLSLVSGLDRCGGTENIVGFYLAAEVNDETGCTGRIIHEGGTFSCGIDDWHMVGRVPGARDCSVNLGRIRDEITKEFPVCVSNDPRKFCKGEFWSESSKENRLALIVNQEFTKYLFNYNEMSKGINCHLTINRSDFPAF